MGAEERATGRAPAPATAPNRTTPHPASTWSPARCRRGRRRLSRSGTRIRLDDLALSSAPLLLELLLKLTKITDKEFSILCEATGACPSSPIGWFPNITDAAVPALNALAPTALLNRPLFVLRLCNS